MAQEEKGKLFREKSLEAVESPEVLNDYLRVTSPGVWLVMAAIIALLVGGILWGIFGRIDTTMELAVSASGGKAVCYVPYDSLRLVMDKGSVTVEGETYALTASQTPEVTIVSEETNPYLRVIGGLKVGDVLVEIPVEAQLADGIYSGTAVTERLQPISLLLQ